MWTETTRKKHARCGIRYASDMTDGEWRLIEPLLPSPRRLGRPRTTNLREVVNALLYIVETGCQWRMVPMWPTARHPADRPPRWLAWTLSNRPAVAADVLVRSVLSKLRKGAESPAGIHELAHSPDHVSTPE